MNRKKIVRALSWTIFENRAGKLQTLLKGIKLRIQGNWPAGLLKGC
jgi:hypothetical protein